MSVTLKKQPTRVSGKRYLYWRARWTDGMGKRCSKQIGRADGSNALSKRQANVLVSRLEADLLQKPGLHSRKVPTLVDYTNQYLDARLSVKTGTVELERQTIKYLVAWFGNIRIDRIDKAAARTFRTALEKGESRIAAANKRWRGAMSAQTVHGHCRRSRTIFQQAVDDDIIIANPFAKIVGMAPNVDKTWNYVTLEMLGCLLDACPTRSWRLLLALCRLAGLRQAEALGLRWSDIQWERNRLIVIGKGDRQREVKLEPELANMLLAAHEQAAEGAEFVIPPESTSVPNLWRDFQVICKRAGLKPYKKWCHTLRKNRQTDWTQTYPEYVVCSWLGNSAEVARKHYLSIPESLYNDGVGSQNDSKVAEKVAETGDIEKG